MAVRSLIQRFEQLAAGPSIAPSTVDVPPDRPAQGARSVLQLAEIFEPGVSAMILARRERSSVDEDAQSTAFDARMRVLPGLRLHRLLRQRRRRFGLNWRPQHPEDQHGRCRQRHRIRHGARWFYSPRVKLSVAPKGPRRFLFELRRANHSNDAE